MILYHGSAQIVEKPDLAHGKKNNDFGRGFYCTDQIEMAKEWACPTPDAGYANVYELQEEGLKVLNLFEEKNTLLPWLALLLHHRQVQITTPLQQEAMEYLLERYLPSTRGVDLIIGYRADDSYYSFARDFVGNSISLEQLEQAMHLGALGKQIVLKSKKAFAQIRFLQAETAEAEVYHARRMQRDQAARAQYRDELRTEKRDGRYMIDLLRSEEDV